MRPARYTPAQRARQAAALVMALAVALCLVPGGLGQPIAAWALGPTTEFEQLVEARMAPADTNQFEVYLMVQDNAFASGGGQTVLAYGLNYTDQLPGGDYLITIDRDGETLLVTKGSVWSPNTYGTWEYDYLTVAVPSNAGSAEADHTYSIQVWSPDDPLEKSAPPTIDVPYAGDENVTGMGIPGAVVTVRFPNESETTVLVDGVGVWTAPVSGTLVVGETVKAYQTESGKAPSDWVSEVVQERVMEISEEPTISSIYTTDMLVVGLGVPYATITVTFPQGGIGTAEVDSEGWWWMRIIESLEEGDWVSAIQTEDGKQPSNSVGVFVRGTNRTAYIDMESTRQTFSHSARIDMGPAVPGVSAYISLGSIVDRLGSVPDWEDYRERERAEDVVKVAGMGPQPRIDRIVADEYAFEHTGGPVELTIEGENLHLYGTLEIRNQKTGESKPAAISADNASASASFALAENTTTSDIPYLFEAVGNGVAEKDTTVVVKGIPTGVVPQPRIDRIIADEYEFEHTGGPVELTIEGENLHLYGTLEIRNQKTGESKPAAISADNASASASFALAENITTSDIPYLFEAVGDGVAEKDTTVVVKGGDEDPDPEDPDPEDPDPEDPDPEDPDPEDPDPEDPDPEDPDPEDPDPEDPDPEDPDPLEPVPETPDPDDREYRGGGSGSGFHGGGQYWRGPAIFDILEHQADMAVTDYWTQWNEEQTVGSDPTVAVQNAGYITKAQLERAASGAREANGKANGPDVTLMLDSTVQGENGLELQGRIYLNPEQVTEDIYTGVYTSGSDVDRTQAIFRGLGLANAQVVSLQQRGDYGLKVEIAADVDLSGLNTANLQIYSYDPYTGEYRRLDSSTAYVDEAGYLHFFTDVGGDIVVADRALGSASGTLSGVDLKKEDRQKLDVKEPEEEPGKDLDFQMEN